MTPDMTAPDDLPNDALLERAQVLASVTHETTAELVAHLGAIDARELYLGLGYSSMFAYCRDVLRFSEGGSYNRIEAARAARRFPVIIGLLAEGAVNLTTVRLLSPHLTVDNHARVLADARFRSRRQVEEMVAGFAPKPAPAASLRRRPSAGVLPLAAASTPAALPVTPAAGAPPRTVTPLAPDTYRLTVSMSGTTRELWDRLRELVDGDDAAVLARVIQAALPVLQRQRVGTTAPAKAAPATRGTSTTHSRHIPAAVRREVYVRDAGTCAYVGWGGHRCSERRYLQFHHVKPWMAGGEATVKNIQLRCGRHNRYEGRLFFDRPADDPGTSASP